jgi:hypothetical protein
MAPQPGLSGFSQLDVWLPRGRHRQIHWAALGFDGLVALAIVAAVAAVVELRTRSTRRLRQISLLELLLLVAAVGPLCGWIHYQRQAWLREQQAIEKLERAQFETQLGGPTWLRLLVGDRPFAWLDRVTGLSVRGVEVDAMLPFTRLRDLRLEGRVPSGDLSRLPELQSLESLAVRVHDPASTRQAAHERMKSLVQAISQLRSLRALEIRYAPIDNDCLEPLAKLSRLTTLDLTGADIDDAGLEQLSRFTPRGPESDLGCARRLGTAAPPRA